MAKLLGGTHARDVGGVIVELGEPIPDDADPDVVQRLETEGVLYDAPEGEPQQTEQSAGRSRKRES